MAQETFSQEAFYSKLEGLGEDEVRAMLATNRIGPVNNKRALAQEWLLRKDLERKDASISEQTRVARSANRAAWTAAITAIIAAIITIIGIVITVILNWTAILRSFSLE